MTPWEQRSEDINYAAKKRTKLMGFIEIWKIGAITNHHLRKRKNAREMACCSIGYWPLIRTTLCLSGILKNMAFGKLCFIWKFFRVAILFYFIFFISLSQFLEHKSGVILETGLWGGSNSPQRYTSICYADHFSLRRTLHALFCTKLR